MSNPGASSAAMRAAAISAVASSLFLSSPARADSKEECRDAYYKTQVLRDDGKLEDAIKEADICVRACGNDLVSDCAKWKTDLEARVASSIIVEVVDPSGAPVTDVSVSLDGVLWLDHLDGTAQIIAKGPHTLEVTAKGADPQKKAVVIRAGEKSRKITISLAAKAVEPEAPDPVHTFGPWIVGGVGVGALIAGAVTGGIVVHDYGVMNDECNEQEGTCSQDGLDASSRGQVLGPVTTSLLVGGGVLVAAGVIWFVAAPRAAEPSATSFFVVPAVSDHEMGAVLGGSW